MFDFLDQYPYLLPIFIFLGRICDVTLGTLRIIFVSKGQKSVAPIIGFFEVFIWIVIISEILSRANSMTAYLSYAAGYASGTYVGMRIENRLAFGILLYRVYTSKDAHELVAKINQQGYGATMITGDGSTGKVDIVETVVGRNEMRKIESVLTDFDDRIFFVTSDVRTAKNGIFPKTQTLFARWRPGK